MNDKEWTDNPEFWDEEEHEEDDDDEYNGHGNDVDANNDETFDNAAEWNEDEHEELIARDLILSHKPSPPKQPAITHQPFQQPPAQQPQVLTVDELERQFLRTSINQDVPPQARIPRAQPETSRRAGWSPFGGKDLFTRDDDLRSAVPASLLDPGLFQSMEPLTLELQQRLILQQQQRLILHQQQLLQQHQQQQQQQQQQQHQQQQQQQQNQNQNQHQQLQLRHDFQHQLLSQQRPHQQQHQQKQQQQQQHFAFLAHAQPQHFVTKPLSTGKQAITVEELERQMLANRTINTTHTEIGIKKINDPPETSDRSLRNKEMPRHLDEPRNRIMHEKRNGERHDRSDRYNRETNDQRDHYRDRRDAKNHKENHRLHRREPIIIPPQVQLGVISKAKRQHSITAMHQDEFIRDRMPAAGEGFRFLRHSHVVSNKVKHDGVLTDKERDWLTRIQEKIQADYDNNLDQDYYYLLYFNRSSMTDEAAQKPMGHGVLDRRFIPRERLLYNSGV